MKLGLSVLLAFALSACESGDVPLAGQINRAAFQGAGLEWPLTVKRGRLGCDDMALYFQAENGTRYGLNGLASKEAGYADIEPIWAVDEKTMKEFEDVARGEDVPTLRISIGDLIREAQKQCS